MSASTTSRSVTKPSPRKRPRGDASGNVSRSRYNSRQPASTLSQSPRHSRSVDLAALEDLRPSASIRGIAPDGLVTVVNVQWYGSDAVELTYKDAAGRIANELLFRHDEPRLEVVEAGRPWSFDGDGALFRLVSEAQRIRLAHVFDPVLAVHTSLVEPLPHHITAVYEAMLPRQPLRFLLADDPGAGAVAGCPPQRQRSTCRACQPETARGRALDHKARGDARPQGSGRRPVVARGSRARAHVGRGFCPAVLPTTAGGASRPGRGAPRRRGLADLADGHLRLCRVTRRAV